MEWQIVVESSLETVQRIEVPGGRLYRSLMYDLDEKVTMQSQALLRVGRLRRPGQTLV